MQMTDCDSAWADVELVRDLGDHKLSLDLDAVIVNGKRYGVLTYDVTRRGPERRSRSTSPDRKFLGGALFGTILGAVAGGGKGQESVL